MASDSFVSFTVKADPTQILQDRLILDLPFCCFTKYLYSVKPHLGFGLENMLTILMRNKHKYVSQTKYLLKREHSLGILHSPLGKGQNGGKKKKEKDLSGRKEEAVGRDSAGSVAPIEPSLEGLSRRFHWQAWWSY